MQKNNNLHSFDAVINEQFGVPGTPEREAFFLRILSSLGLRFDIVKPLVQL